MFWLVQSGKRHPHKPCINGYTYQHIFSAIQTVGELLTPTVSRYSRVALLSGNSVTMAIYLLALAKMGVQVLLLNTHLTTQEIEKQCQQLQVECVISAPNLANGIPSVIPHIVMEPIHMEQIHIRNDAFTWPLYADNEVPFLMNTSATSGVFKTVPLRWGQIYAHVQSSQQMLGVADDDCWMMVLPLFHVSGLSILMRTLYNGTATQIAPKYNESEVVQAINEERITMISLVPTLLNTLVDHIEPHRLRVILLGGEWISPTLVERCLAKQLPIYKTYGMTETFSQTATVNVLAHPDKRESVGYPLPGMKVSVVNPDSDGIGELYIEGPMVMDGYVGQNSIHGVIQTGDMGYTDEDGYIYILNRRKDLIISGGENIYPKELEDIVTAVPGVAEAAVVPVPDTTWGQVPALFVVGAKDAAVQALQDQLASYKWPKYVYAIEALPRNGTGKVMRQTLQEWHTTGKTL